VTIAKTFWVNIEGIAVTIAENIIDIIVIGISLG
jgi:hypothetical protein